MKQGKASDTKKWLSICLAAFSALFAMATGLTPGRLPRPVLST